jgi:mannose-1-phosphate guanylyltransferase
MKSKQDKVPTEHFHALIMAGGKGERFWPLSRESRPKQVLSLLGDKTMIELTVERLLPLIPRERIWIVTNAGQAKMMARVMPKFPKKNFIIEPVGRDSAGAVMLGCAQIAQQDPQAITALLPADHLIKDIKGYLTVLENAFRYAARSGDLLTIGIKPWEPSSAYGYIERGEPIPFRAKGDVRFYKVRKFVEKPDLSTAREMLKTRRFYWNAGMFVWSVDAIRQAFERHSPVHAEGWEEIIRSSKGYMRGGFLNLPKISIDYAVMEKARNIGMAEGEFDWDDVGSWSALARHLPMNSEGNAVKGEALTVDARDCMVFGEKQTIALLGVKDLIVVQTADAILICHKDAAQRVKEVVHKLPKKLL